MSRTTIVLMRRAQERGLTSEEVREVSPIGSDYRVRVA
jgi:hypothetical protein